MYYLKNFILYSIFGFIMESTLFKITNSIKYSSIFYGPMTTVYGFGIIAIILLNKYLFSKINLPKIIKIIIEYIILFITLSVIEYLGGNILNYLFDIDMWDYSKIPYHYGKYICLQNSLIWGLLGVAYLHIFKPFTDKILKVINSKETFFFFILFLIDLLLVILFKL